VKAALAKEVTAMLNIEAGESLYRHDEEIRVVLHVPHPPTTLYVDGSDERLIVMAPSLGHRRGFRFGWRANRKPEERFDWAAIHKRVEKLLAEEPTQ
jgi:hypothetical protein